MKTTTNASQHRHEIAAHLCVCIAALLPVSLGGAARAAAPLTPIPRRLPPAGIDVSAGELARLREALTRVETRLNSISEHPKRADAEIFTKAVSLALRHNEFYRDGDVNAAHDMLKIAQERIDSLAKGELPWAAKPGLVVRGYRSSIDDSVQPYGLWIAGDVDFSSPVPLYVWLHGRGDKVTDLHFIRQRLSRDGTITPPGAIVVHPFGRQCIGFKSAGEIDVLEAIEDVAESYLVDRNKIALLGFSMGGAGAWHLGAHYADRWVAVSAGAGFAETALYNRLRTGDLPPSYEQRLWGLYDVPNYVRNLFNLPVVAYSGELDKQIQAARVMEEAYQQEGRTLTHLIGPGMGHKYHPDTLDEILTRVQTAVEQGNNSPPMRVSLQTRSLRYSRMKWVSVQELVEHWNDSRVDAEILNDGQLRVETSNIRRLRLNPWPDMSHADVTIDGEQLTVSEHAGDRGFAELVRTDRWRESDPATETSKLSKRPGLQGPIDDLFLEPFLVVSPSGVARFPHVQEWVGFELEHFHDRWRSVFRGDLRSKVDRMVTADDILNYHLVLWGDPQSNRLIDRLLRQHGDDLPFRWTDEQIEIGTRSYSAEDHLPVLIFPNPLNPKKYVVFNSGPTFREAHDRTNSLQNPQLPDWAVIDLRQPPDDQAPGRIVSAGFFDESWQVK